MSLVRLRGGTTAEWASANPILAARECGVDVTTHTLRVGDGVTHWLDLPDVAAAGSATIAGTVVVDADYDVQSDDVVVIATAACTVTLPTAVYAAGRLVYVKSTTSGVVTVEGTENIDDVASIALSQWEAVTVVSDDTQWQVI